MCLKLSIRPSLRERERERAAGNDRLLTLNTTHATPGNIQDRLFHNELLNLLRRQESFLRTGKLVSFDYGRCEKDMRFLVSKMSIEEEP